MTTPRVTQLLSIAARALNRRADAELVATGMRMAHVPVVVLLQNSPDGMTQKALAAAVGVEQPSMAQLLARMERDGLVTRVPHQTDARSQLVLLAADQGRRIREAQEVLAQLETGAVDGLSDKEVRTLMHLLSRVVDNLREPADD